MIAAAIAAQAPEPPISDTRLTVNTLVREDVFAGFLQNDLARLTRAEKNIELLLASRPAEPCQSARVAGKHRTDARGCRERIQAAG